jgi:hypothetical protein
MPGFTPGIHVFFEAKMWMAGTSPAMTVVSDLEPSQGLTSTVLIAISTPPGMSGLSAFE